MNSVSKPLDLCYVDTSVLPEHTILQKNLLGGVIYSRQSVPQLVNDLCLGVVPLQVLSEPYSVCSAWLSENNASMIVSGCDEPVQYRYNQQFLFGFIQLSESAFAENTAAPSLQQASFTAYERIFEVLNHTQFPYIVRCWNYLPRINDLSEHESDGHLERYRLFNIGRQDAFIQAQQDYLAGSPSACALGTHDGDLIVYFLAAKTAPLAIENPRQMSAYHYPQQYGPRSPTFSRASLLSLDNTDVLFISGTASIVGHETLHHGDVAAQTVESLRNIEVIVEQANLKLTRGAFNQHKLLFKVFIRHASDFRTVEQVMKQHLGEHVNLVCLCADICRSELLVEIEAFGFLSQEDACV